MKVRLDVQRSGDVFRAGGRFVVEFQQASRLSQTELDREIDRHVARHLANQFLESIKRNAAPLWPDAKAYPSSRDDGFTLADPQAESGFVRICPTHARILGGGPTIRANFLRRGSHWAAVRDAVREFEQRPAATFVQRPERQVSRGPIRVPIRRLNGAPPGTPSALLAAGLQASGRIRLERRMVFARPVALETERGQLTFSPIVGSVGDLVVPFRLVIGEAAVDGGIALSGQSDPLVLELYRDGKDVDDVFLWVSALCGFADLTTHDLVTSARATDRRAGFRARNTAAREWRQARAVPIRRAQSAWPPHLQPLGNTAQDLASHVVGHRRRLAEGRSAGREAVERAAAVGIRLRPGETWVRPHVRGLPTGDDLRFRWANALVGGSFLSER